MKIKERWEALPKVIKVFCYIALSEVLAELLIELTGIEQTFIIRASARVINLAIVFMEDSVPAIRTWVSKRLKG